MSTISYKDKHVLQNLYLGDGLSCNLIAERFRTKASTVRYWMNKFEIPRRDMSSAVKIVYTMGYRMPHSKGSCLSDETKKAVSDGLKRAYQTGRRKSWNKGKKTSRKQREAISEGLRKAYAEGRRRSLKNVPSPNKARVKVKISKQKLKELYCEQKMPAHKIAKKFDVSRQTVINYARILGVKIRGKSEASRCFSWNRGLTKERDRRVRRIAEKKRGKPRPDFREMQYNPEFLRKKLKGLIKRPTRPEEALISIITKYSFPFIYTGDGEIVIGLKCPDFVSTNSDNKLIEVFGRVFHDPERSFRHTIPWHQQYWGRIAYYAKNGYDCLVLWDDELENEEKVVNKIRSFMGGTKND